MMKKRKKGCFIHHASRQKEHPELNCNVYSTMADTTIIIKVKGQVAIQYWHKGDNVYSTVLRLILI
jgi:hypothetical protein